MQLKANLILTVLLCFFLYGVFSAGEICEGKKKNLIFVMLTLSVFSIGAVMGLASAGCLGVLIASEVFVYFYTEGDFAKLQCNILLPGGWLLLCTLCLRLDGYLNASVAFTFLVWILFVLLSWQRGYLHCGNAAIVSVVYLILIGLDVSLTRWGDSILTRKRYEIILHAIILLLSLSFFGLLEITLRSYERGFQHSSKELREQMLAQQFQEVQAVYLNMRGWRHDYHNHIQVLKANLDQNQYGKAREYLNSIEQELSQVDTFIKSGNLMTDAILNSKLTLASQKHIKITCDAFVPEQLFLSDIDLCIILGNVLDNAIESCEKLTESERFLRIYLAMQKEQLYLSVQNSSVQIIDFEQKNYITTKRGNHGLGMKRVAAVVNKWNGFLNLNQEPGIFATEIMLPCPKEDV